MTKSDAQIAGDLGKRLWKRRAIGPAAVPLSFFSVGVRLLLLK